MAKGKKLTTLLLIFSLMGLSMNLYAEKKGADIIVQKKDGQQTKGVLITVKENSILLMDSESGADVSVDISDIKIVKIVRESKAGKGTLYGFFTGVSIGVLAGYSSDSDTSPGRTESVAIVGIAYGLLGILMGTIAGALAGKDSIIQIKGRSDSGIKEILDLLRSEARVKNYQ